MARISTPRIPLGLLSGLVLLFAATLAGCPQAPDNRPEAAFSATPRTGNVPLTVSFQDASTVASGTIQSWIWNFGDGNYSTSPNPTHVYNIPGNFTVSLTVTAATGSHTRTIAGFIQATERTAYGTIGAAGGAVNVTGASVIVPAGAFASSTTVGISRNNAAFQPGASEPVTVLSPAFRITRSGNSDAAYGEAGDGSVVPSEIEVRYETDQVPVSDRNGDFIHILALLPDGLRVPIASIVQGDRVRASVLRLPADATYAAIYRPGAVAFDVVAPAKSGIVTPANWGGGWRVQMSDALLQQLTALRVGSKANTPAYDRRNFETRDLDQTLADLTAALSTAHTRLSTSGLRAPLLVNNNGRYGLLLYNIKANYTPGYNDFRDEIYRTDLFGNLVVDPRELIDISRQNMLDVIAHPEWVDVDQELGVPNAFGQGVIDAVIAGYDYPRFATEGTDNEGPVNFLDGIALGLAANTGQVADGLSTARTFGPNEVALLSEQLFWPELADEAAYGVASQDFFVYLDRRFNLNGSLRPIAESGEDPAGLLEEIRRDFATGFIGVPPTPREALLRAYGAADRAFRAQLGSGLGQIFWLYTKDRAVENPSRARLRPSDQERVPNTLNAALFGDGAVLTHTMDAPTDAVVLGGEEDATLGEIAPLSARAVVIELRPQTTELTLTFNRADWAVGENGGTVNVKVYREGLNGTELAANRSAITLRNFTQDPDDCVAKVIVLIGNANLEEANSVEIAVQSFSGLVNGEESVLDEYVQACDADFTWERTSSVRIAAQGVTVHHLEMVTSAWRGLGDLDQTNWRHNVTVIEPDDVRHNTAFLAITGGSTGSTPGNAPAALVGIATASRGIVAQIAAVPNQPLTFEGETSSRVEDEIIAKSFSQYLNSHEARKTDVTWPALLPMTRSAVRAMDAVQEFMASGEARNTRTIDDFVVGGASKRGWTTWLTAAADERVRGIVPIVIDVLNMDEQMEHHFNAYGFYAPAIQDYVIEGVFDRLGTAAGQSLLEIVDPFSYRTRLTMPKMIANSTGDQFFLPDSSQFYFDQLPGQNYLYYAPNTDHGLGGGLGDLDNTSIKSIIAWYLALVFDRPLPVYDWTYTAANEITVTTGTEPESVKLWQATNATARDFRLETIGARWTSTELEEVDGEYVGSVPVPSTGWTGFFIQITWPGPVQGVDADFIFTTPVRVIPDVYPAPAAE